MACGTPQRAIEQRAVAGVLYKRVTHSGGDHGDREHGGDHGERERARRWEASSGGRGGGKLAVEGAAVES